MNHENGDPFRACLSGVAAAIRDGNHDEHTRAELEKLRAAIELAYLQIYYPDEAPAPEEI